MTHDPLCPNNDPRVQAAIAAAMQSVGAKPTGYCQFCPVIARVREDERGYAKQTSAAVMAYGEGKRDGYTAALRDAVEAVRQKTLLRRRDSLLAIAAIEALGEER